MKQRNGVFCPKHRKSIWATIDEKKIRSKNCGKNFGLNNTTLSISKKPKSQPVVAMVN